MSRLLMRGSSEMEREQAVMKLYVMLLQSSGWSNRKGGENSDGLSSIVDIKFPDFLKHIANIVLRKDRHHSDHVSPTAHL
jgi:hypothetical protein